MTIQPNGADSQSSDSSPPPSCPEGRAGARRSQASPDIGFPALGPPSPARHVALVLNIREFNTGGDTVLEMHSTRGRASRKLARYAG